MMKRFVVSIKELDEEGRVLRSEDISTQEIRRPETLGDLGYSQQEGLEMIQALEKHYIAIQSDFLKSASD